VAVFPRAGKYSGGEVDGTSSRDGPDLPVFDLGHRVLSELLQKREGASAVVYPASSSSLDLDIGF